MDVLDGGGDVRNLRELVENARVPATYSRLTDAVDD
jgi:hypothetical protein